MPALQAPFRTHGTFQVTVLQDNSRFSKGSESRNYAAKMGLGPGQKEAVRFPQNPPSPSRPILPSPRGAAYAAMPEQADEDNAKRLQV